MPYNPSQVEPRWQSYWEENKTFCAKIEPDKPKFYALDMFPYPSGKGLHIGHPASYIGGDIVCRKRRAQGFNVLHPMGYDAFGLPAEQLAIDCGIPPQESTKDAIENFRRQLKMCGFSYDWDREVSTSDPAFYKWTQWIFAQLYERGLAYEAETFVNWCPALGTVLANDEVIDGKSERGGHPVERVRRKQWMIKITDYAERLLADLTKIDWPEHTKQGQGERIGRSEGAELTFPLVGHDTKLEVFSTRPDTIFGATYMVVAPEHPIVEEIVSPEKKEAVETYQRRTASMSEIDRQAGREKTGVDIGARCLNPATGEEIPVWISDYVIYGYGTGAIMAVPAHDQRDWDFATSMSLPIRQVISGGDIAKSAHSGEGTLINSGDFDGVPTKDGEAVRKLTAWLEARGAGKKKINYRLRDWTFARQRYWGEPIPIVKDEFGQVVRALSVDELPVELPEVLDYRPTGTGESPTSTAKEWMHVEDNGRALVRETDTMPGSAGSSWYFLRYCDPKNEHEFCAREASDYWMPVDLYVGGPEHTVGHLMYSRMWQKALFDMGLVRDDEPFSKLRHQGMIQAFTYYDPTGRVVPSAEVETRGEAHYQKGTDVQLTVKVEKMSKRKGNVVNPDDVIARYGADAMRIYLCFLGPMEQDKPWAESGVESQANWLKRLWRIYFEGDADKPRVTDETASEEELRTLHKAIKKVSEDIEKMAFNTAISALHVATRELLQSRASSRSVLEPLIQLVAPFAPHFAEEVWQVGLGEEGGISFAPWPDHDPALVEDTRIKMGVQVLGKTRGEIEIESDADQERAVSLAKSCESVQRQLEGKEIVRVIYKPGRILNLIVK